MKKVLLAVFVSPLAVSCGNVENHPLAAIQSPLSLFSSEVFDANNRVFSFYVVEENYKKVSDDVFKWTRERKINMCVAYMSTALRMTGTYIPRDQKIGGFNVSLVTRPFSIYLTQTLKWQKFTSFDDLRAGDVAFTQDGENDPGYPTHTFMFVDWKDRNAGIATIVDNQGFMHDRYMLGDKERDHTPFAYALRAPLKK